MAAKRSKVTPTRRRASSNEHQPAPDPKGASGKAILVGAGIGSAAIAAAVLYITRKKKPGLAKA